MTPNDSAGKRTSGNPATQAHINLTVKQQREQQKQEKLAEYQRQLAKRKRTKATWWIVGTTAAVLVIGLVVASVIFTPRPVSIARGDGDGSGISGIQTFEHTATHVEGEVDYEQTPPAGGDHNAVWLNCGVYSEPVPNINAVHSLEHGAIWITYDPDQVDQAQIDALDAQLPSTYTLLSPYPDMDTPIAVSAWDAQITVDSPDDERIGEFIKAYWRNVNGPEPGAACSGALDGPGKQ